MKVAVNEVDLSQFWKFQVIEGQLWLEVGFLSDLGIHVHETPQFGTLMVCTEIECVPFKLHGQDKQAMPKGEHWFVKWEAIAKAIQCQWEQKGDEIFVSLPPSPLPRPLNLGDEVPDIALWRKDSIPMRLYDWAGKPFLLALKPNRHGELGERILTVKFALDFENLPEGSYADPFGVAFQIFGESNFVGVSSDLVWLANFEDEENAANWLENQPSKSLKYKPSLAIVLNAWLETIKRPNDAQAWLTLADVQRLYCGFDASVSSYEKAIQLSKGSNPEVESWARWRLGALKWLQGEKEVARKVWSQGSLPKTAQELKNEHLR